MPNSSLLDTCGRENCGPGVSDPDINNGVPSIEPQVIWGVPILEGLKVGVEATRLYPLIPGERADDSLFKPFNWFHGVKDPFAAALSDGANLFNAPFVYK